MKHMMFSYGTFYSLNTSQSHSLATCSEMFCAVNSYRFGDHVTQYVGVGHFGDHVTHLVV